MILGIDGTRILLATIDNHAVVRAGLEAHITEIAPDIEFVASAGSVDEYLSLGVHADVILLDLLLQLGTSLDAIPALIAQGSKVLMYTTEERPVPLRRAVAAGAHGVLLKSDPLGTVAEGIRMALKDEFCCSGPMAHALITDPRLVVDLSDQQRQVLQCIDEGLDYRATGRVMGISEGSVKTYLARIREKYRAVGIEPGNSHNLTRRAFEEGHLG